MSILGYTGVFAELRFQWEFTRNIAAAPVRDQELLCKPSRLHCLTGLASVLFLLLSAGSAFCQMDTVLYTGVNGRLTSPEKALVKKEIVVRSRRKVEVRVFGKEGNTWRKSFTELMSTGGDGIWEIRIRGIESREPYERKYDAPDKGIIHFTEFSGKQILREGFTLLQIPLILNGEVKEFYSDGTLRSRSLYRNNELVSNENWLKNGERTIDNLFYLVDEEPMLSGGNFKLHQHVRQAFIDSGLDLSAVSGTMMLGFIVMETGEIEGIRILKGLSPQLNEIALNALQSLGGKWKPARLNGRDVRYFQYFPINFISRESTFQYLEISGPVIHYNYE